MVSNSRLNTLYNHLNPKFSAPAEDDSLEQYRRKSKKISPDILLELYLGKQHDFIKFLRSQTKDSPTFNHQEFLFLDREAAQLKVYQQIKEVYLKHQLTYEEDLKNPIKKMSFLQILAEFDLSSSTRMIVHTTLYIDILQNIGTSKHRRLIDRAYSLEDYGCFAMTEIGHGSNVSGLETTAEYDHASKEFVFNTPSRNATKWWIGAAGKTANMAAVWAQLIVNGENKGVHVFALEIRDYSTHNPKQGILIGDCGKKIDLDGIDNGFIIFNNYRAPYNSLLDKLCQISDGKYKSQIKNKEKRLGTMLAGLIRGRFGVVLGSEIILRNALTIALRFSALRKQFSIPGQPESSVLDYQLHRHRLVPILSRLFAIRAGGLYLYEVYSAINRKIIENPEIEEVSELHAVLSVFKPISSSYAFSGIQECRESTGGHGYSAYAGFGRLRNTCDVMLTWEGDNNVLIQQTGKFIMKTIQHIFKGIKNNTTTLSFLKINNNSYKWPIKSAADLHPSNILGVFHSYINFLAMESMKKLQENSMEYKNNNDVWNNSQVNYISTLSYVYGEHLLYKELVALAGKVKDRCKTTGEVIEKISELYALDCWERKQRIYVDFACSYTDCCLIRDRHAALCKDLGEYSISVIEAIASNDRFIGSILGYQDGQPYTRLVQAVENEKNVYEPPSWYSEIQSTRNLANKQLNE